MTEWQRNFYLLLLMTGRTEEAEAYIEDHLKGNLAAVNNQETKSSKNKQRYLTAGVRNTVPNHLIDLMWELFDQMDIPEKDYLQIFELEKITGPVQTIRHWQEIPAYHSPVIYLPYGPYWTGKVYVIDDGDAITMCLPEER